MPNGSMPNMSWIFTQSGLPAYKSDWTDAHSVENAVRDFLAANERRASERLARFTWSDWTSGGMIGKLFTKGSNAMDRRRSGSFERRLDDSPPVWDAEAALTRSSRYRLGAAPAGGLDWENPRRKQPGFESRSVFWRSVDCRRIITRWLSNASGALTFWPEGRDLVTRDRSWSSG